MLNHSHFTVFFFKQLSQNNAHFPLLFLPFLFCRHRQNAPFRENRFPFLLRPRPAAEAQPPPLLPPRRRCRHQPDRGARRGGTCHGEVPDDVRRGGHDGRPAHGAPGRRLRGGREGAGDLRVGVDIRAGVSDGHELRIHRGEVQREQPSRAGAEHGAIGREGDAGGRRQRAVPVCPRVCDGEDALFWSVGSCCGI